MPLPSDRLTRARRIALAEAVRRHREARDLSQQGLGEKAGWDRQSVNRVENLQRSPSFDRLCSLAAALGVRLSDLMRVVEDSPSWPGVP